MKKDTILDLMVAQHALIGALFVAFKDDFKISQEKAKVFFVELIGEVKKHFFIEEQAIFNLLPWKDPEISKMVAKLKREHVLMIAHLEKDLEDWSEKEIDKEYFSKLMEGHLETEEKNLYPLLDERLNDEEKKLIISRINGMPFGPK